MPIEEHRFESNQGAIHIKTWRHQNPSNHPPIVLLHDSLGCVGLWKDFPEHLSERSHRTVIAYDRLGFGKSEMRQEKPGKDFIEQEAISVFPQLKEHLAIDKYILFGHSVGGAMAIEIASRDPDCLALITESAQAFVEEKTIQGIKQAKELFSQGSHKDRLKKWHGEKTDWVLSAWIEVWLSDGFLNWSLEQSIQSVSCPVLAIHGENDDYGSVAFPEFIAGKSSGKSEIFIVPDCGHVPHREKQDLVLTKILGFMDNDY